MGKLFFSMAIFNSYVRLPEGKPQKTIWNNLCEHTWIELTMNHRIQPETVCWFLIPWKYVWFLLYLKPKHEIVVMFKNCMRFTTGTPDCMIGPMDWLFFGGWWLGHSGICSAWWEKKGNISGWWFAPFFMCPYIENFILPTDKLNFFKLKPPTICTVWGPQDS